jgi:hypothetical protein
MFFNQTICMNDEQVLRRRHQRSIVESDTDDDDQVMDLKDKEIKIGLNLRSMRL